MREGQVISSADRYLGHEASHCQAAFNHLPDLHLPELHDPVRGSPPAPGTHRVPSVLQKLQKWGDYPSYGQAVEPTL